MCAVSGDYAVTKNHMGDSYAYCAIFRKEIIDVIRDVSLTDIEQQDSASIRLMNVCRQHASGGETSDLPESPPLLTR